MAEEWFEILIHVSEATKYGARVELAELYKELLKLMPNIKSNGEFEWAKTVNIAGAQRMPVKY